MYKMLKIIICNLNGSVNIIYEYNWWLKIITFIIFSHQLYSYIILMDPLTLQIIVFSILYMIYLKMAYM
jgi:hypothetical protein